MAPAINGTMHHFNYVGLYDGLAVIQDSETRTLWNHITGEALYGPLVGRTLGNMSNLLQMTVSQALEVDPATQAAISDRTYFAGGRELGTAPGLSPRPWAPDNPNALQLAGRAEFEAKNYKQAIVYWQKVLEKTSGNAELQQAVSKQIEEAKSLAGTPAK